MTFWQFAQDNPGTALLMVFAVCWLVGTLAEQISLAVKGDAKPEQMGSP